VPRDPSALGPDTLAFLTERHLATLTTLRADGTPHVVPVGVTYDAQTATARLITSGSSLKARHVREGRQRVAVCQVKDPRAPLHEGHAVADAVERYARRYRQPQENPSRVAIEITVDRILGNA
jgi:general stress protein 26